MKLASGSLETLVRGLRARTGSVDKTFVAAKAFGRGHERLVSRYDQWIENGDDAAALRSDGSGSYLLFAAKGMRGEFLALPTLGSHRLPRACWRTSTTLPRWAARPVGHRRRSLSWARGRTSAFCRAWWPQSQAFGHPRSSAAARRASPARACSPSAVLGRANRLIPSGGAEPGARSSSRPISLNGSFRGSRRQLQCRHGQRRARRSVRRLRVLPDLAEAGLVAAGKDISMAGILRDCCS